MGPLVRTLLAATVLIFCVSGTASAATWKVGEPAPNVAEDRIVNGTAAPDAIPWQVALVRLNSAGETTVPLQIYCGGTLTALNRVVTAAHCLPDDPGDDPSEIGVVAGLYRASNPTLTGAVLAGVSTVTSHPSYRSTSAGFDAAVLTLTSNLTPSARIGTRPVAAANAGAFTNAIAMISGWGTLSSGGQQPDDLQYTTINVYPDSNCSGYGTSYITQTMLCAGFIDSSSNVYDTCQGDSGGPLMLYDGAGSQFSDFTTLIGIVSFGRGCAEAQFPGIYTRVTEPSINALLTASNPAARVKRMGDPVISTAGSTITCTAATWGNSPTTVTPNVLLLTGTVDGQTLKVSAVEEKPGRSYTTTNADNGKFAQCEERATNAGGSLVQESGIINAPAAPAPTPAPTPTPAPAPTATPAPGAGGPLGGGVPGASDLTAPTSSVTRRSCSRTRVCTLTVKVADTGGADPSRAKVRATVTQLSGCPKGRRGRACRKARTFNGSRSGAGVFTIKTTKLRKGRVRIVIRATDAAGNEQEKATSVTLTVR